MRLLGKCLARRTDKVAILRRRRREHQLVVAPLLDAKPHVASHHAPRTHEGVRRMLRTGFGERLRKLREAARHERDVDRVFIREVVVEIRRRHIELAPEPAHRERVETAIHEHLESAREDLVFDFVDLIRSARNLHFAPLGPAQESDVRIQAPKRQPGQARR